MYHKVNKHYLKTIIISHKNKRGLFNSKGLQLHLQFVTNRIDSIKSVWKNLITNLLNNKLESTLFTEFFYNKINYNIIT